MFQKIDNALLNTGNLNGDIPVIGAGGKLANSLFDTGVLDGQIPVVGTGDKLPSSLFDLGENANQLLQLDGSGKLPAVDGSLLTNLSAPSNVGAWDLIEEQNASNSAQVDFTTGIDNTYKTYKIIVASLLPSASDGFPNLQVQIVGNSSFEGFDYNFASFRVDQSSTGTHSTGSSSTDQWIELGGGIGFGNGPGSGQGGFLEITINDPSNTARYTHISWNAAITNSSTDITRVIGGGIWDGGVQAIDGIRLFANVGSFASGNFKLYGVN